MEFFKCSIAGVKYGSGVTEVQRAMMLRKGEHVPEQGSEPAPRERGMNFEDPRVMDGAWREQPTAAAIEEFFRALALCHTVIPEGGTDFNSIVYQAASPDDVALCLAAKHAGWFFQRRATTSLELQVTPVNSEVNSTTDPSSVLWARCVVGSSCVVFYPC